jgi:chromosome partitioning protein
MNRPRIVSVVNHKGGVLKTTTTASLGAALAREGYRVLLLDLDAQQNLTTSLIGMIALDLHSDQYTLYEALTSEGSLDALITATGRAGLDIVPCAEDLSGADMSLVSVIAREHVLRRCFEQTARLPDYDFVLIDNPPSISLLVINALAASDYFLVPVSAEYMPMVGLTMLGNSVGRIQPIAPQLKPLGVLLTNYAQTESICRTVESALRRELGAMLLETKIRVNTKAKSAPGVRQTIFEYEEAAMKKKAAVVGRGTEDYTRLAREVLERLGADAPSRPVRSETGRLLIHG